MFETLFGADVPLAVRFLIAFLIVLGLIGGTAWGVRRFGGDRLGSGALRGRQPRLAVIDATAVDGRRRLVLIRRDNVEHLLMIGGPTDVVVEPNIVRAVSARDNTPAARGADTLPRAVPLPEASNWPLQPEPAPVTPSAPVSRPAARAPLIEEPAAWTVPDPEPAPVVPARPPRAEPRPTESRIPEPRIPEPRVAEPRLTAEPRQPEARPFDPRLDARQIETRRPEPRPAEPRAPEPRIPERSPEQRGADTLAGLADELTARQQPSRETAREPVRPEPVRASSAPQVVTPAVAADAPAPDNNDQNLADMAQRLEAALRRPMAEALAAETAPSASEPVAAKPVLAARAAEPVRAPVAAPAPTTPQIAPPVAPPVAAQVAAAAPAPSAPEPKPAARAEVKTAQPANFYDSLEQEMASLLGRPQNKG